MSRIFLTSIFFLFIISNFSCTTSEAKRANPFDGLTVEQSLEKFKVSPFIKNASYSFCVISTKTGKTIFSLDENRSLIPASSFKILTTAASLSLLSDSFKFETKLAYTGNIVDGVLNGDIFILGGGDPTLGSSKFNNNPGIDEISNIFTREIKKLGIKEIQGNICAYPNIFGECIPPPNWLWQDIGNYFGAIPCGINFNDNTYHMVFQTGAKKGDPTTITKIIPEIPDMKVIENKIITDNVGTADNAFIYGAPFDNNRYTDGALPPNFPAFWIQGAIPNPPLFCAQMLFKKLNSSGVKLNGMAKVEKKLPQNFKVFFTHVSPDLKKIIYKTLLESNNMYTELLLRNLGYVIKKDGNLNMGIEVLKTFCASKMTDTTGLTITDASGLSRPNLISAKQQADFLNNMCKDKSFESFFECLPFSGGPGLFRFGSGTLAVKNLRAKSGYMSKVKSYAGYIHTKSGERLAFSFIVNGYTCSQYYITPLMEPIITKLAELE